MAEFLDTGILVGMQIKWFIPRKNTWPKVAWFYPQNTDN